MITGDRRTAVPPAVASAMTERIVLRLTEPDDYASLGLEIRDLVPTDLPPGRGYVEGSLEVQCAISESPDGNLDLALSHSVGDEVPPVLTLPLRVGWKSPPQVSAPLSFAIGISDDDREPAFVDLSLGHFAVVGPYRSGRTTALATAVRSLGEIPGVRLLVLNPRGSHLRSVAGNVEVAEGLEASAAAAQRCLDELMSNSADAGPFVLVIDDAGELTDGPSMPVLEQIVMAGRDRQVRVMAAFEVHEARGYAPWIRQLRRDRHGLLLEPDRDLDGDLLGVRLPKRTTARTPGRGYLVENGRATLVQTAVVG